MSALPPVEPLLALTAPELSALRHALTRAGFDGQIVAEGERVAPGHFDAARLPLVNWALARREGGAALLARLFVYLDGVDRTALLDVVGSAALAALVRGGLVEDGPAGVRARFRVTPFDGLWVVHDDFHGGGEVAMGPGPTTAELARWMPPVKGAVLDVGCGAGTLALAASRAGASRVVGTDINPRAVALAQLNARLNDLSAEFRVGSLLEPVQGQRFELVVAQPPYVLRPESVEPVTYLHGGENGDELSLSLLRALPSALEPGGCAALLFDSPVRKGQPLVQRVREALGDAAVDLALFTARGPSVDLQAIAYASLHATVGTAEYAKTVVRYRQHIERRGIAEVSHALALLWCCEDKGGRFAVSVPVRALDVPQGGMPEVKRWLEHAGLPPPSLMRATLRPSRFARFCEERASPGAEGVEKITVRLGAGALAVEQELTPAALALFGSLETAPTVREGIAAYAELCGAGPQDVAGEAVELIRQALIRGVLVPA